MTTFHDPRDFLAHLEAQTQTDLTPEQCKTLMLASCHVIKYLLNSQVILSSKMISAVDCLNQHHTSWAHKLSELYQVLEAGDVDPDTMQLILIKEVCGDHTQGK
jgi:hypothetical protein